ncbi:MAG: Crp/Fnr family transcriptional regulator, partial [Comamonas sp.]
WFGELSLFDQSPRSHDVYATEPSCVLQVPLTPLLQWLEQHPEHWRSLALLVTLKLRQALITLEDQSVLAAPQRLARRLVNMAEDYGLRLDTTQSRRMLNLSQEQLARMLALSRQTTNQILQELQQRGMIRLYRGKLEILDLAKLRESCLASAPMLP